MSYVEMGSAIFRGNLAGATGDVRFKLTAEAIDAVDTINIQNGSVTSYVVVVKNTAEMVDKDGTYMFVNVMGDSDDDCIDLYAYVDSKNKDMKIFHNGKKILDRSQKYKINDRFFKFRAVIRSVVGENVIAIVNKGATQDMASGGFILAGYIRETGAA